MPHKAGSSLSQPYDATLLKSAAGTCPFYNQKAGIIARAHRDCQETFQAGWTEMVLHRRRRRQAAVLPDRRRLVRLQPGREPSADVALARLRQLERPQAAACMGEGQEWELSEQQSR